MRRWILRLCLLLIVATLLPACKKSRSGIPVGGAPAAGGPPPIGLAVSGLQSLSRGGAGATFNGGTGGGFFLSGSTGSDVRILRSGTVNSVVNPLVILPNLGSNPRTVSTSQTWTVNTGSGGELTPGFLLNAQFVQGDLPGNATGLWIQPGVTLTIHPQFTSTFLWLSFSDSVYIEGTLRVGFGDVTTTGDQLSDDSADFQLDVNENLIITSTGVIDLSGRNDSAGTDADTTGGNGGFFFTSGATATIVNAGRIDVRGGTGDQGGTGGLIDMDATLYGLYNSGTLIASGGPGTLAFAGPAAIASVADTSGGTTVYTLEAAAPAWIVAGGSVNVDLCTDPANNGPFSVASVSGVTLTLNNGSGVAELLSPGAVGLSGGMGGGGNSGQVFLSSNSSFIAPGGLFNTGTITTRGGDGTGGGGGGDTIVLDAGGAGAFTSSGILDSSGGDATSVAANGSGGGAGRITITGRGTLRMTGSVTARGGDGLGMGDGGSGNTIEIDTFDSGSISSQNVLGGVAIGVDFNTNGGDGATGGGAGSVDIEARAASSSINPGQDIVWFVGYDAIDTSGGKGRTYGGDAGDIDIFNSSASSGSVDYQGSIRNEVPLIALGGDGTTGDGGRGGSVDITNDSGGTNNNRSVTNIAAIDVRGGNAPGVAVGGPGGDIFMYDNFLVQNTATLNASGGSAAGLGNGGDGGGIQLVSDDICSNVADLTVTGGSSAGSNGGSGGKISLQGRSTSTTGTLSADGANGGTNPANQGGWGGSIEVFSSESISDLHGTLSVRAGAATVAGQHGQIVLDGLVIELVGGRITFP